MDCDVGEIFFSCGQLLYKDLSFFLLLTGSGRILEQKEMCTCSVLSTELDTLK